MTDYRVEVKVKNNNLLRKLEECGYSSVGDFCRRNDKMCWTGTIGEFVNLKRSPLNAKGQFHQVIYDICDILLCSPEELFSEVQLTTALESNRRTIEVNEAEMQFMLQNQCENLLLEDQLDRDRLSSKMDELLKTLTPREAKVIRARFGLDGRGAQTLEEIGRLFDVNKERIRQLEAKALRKLRHPSINHIVRDYFEN